MSSFHVVHICINPACQKEFVVATCQAKKGRSKYCSILCYRNDRPRFVEARFWKKVEKSSDPDGCWIWTGSRHAKGYGRFVISTQITIAAHRFSYQTYIGPIPEGMLVCHVCDRPSCIRQDHLFLGTPQENSKDAARKGRLWNTGGHNAKFTEKDVLYIRSMKGKLSAVALAKEFDVSPVTIWDAWSQRTYQHIF